MRLLRTKTYQFESFEDWNAVPPYAILSHTWGEGEVLFHDIANGIDKMKEGWTKIVGACNEAEKLGIFHVWVDTCCIFKESSAELSESINSMFAWYRGARICFAYLGDLVNNDDWVSLFSTTTNIYKSRWWTRGWTLQELIAPKEVMFFNRSWNFVDLRSSLAEHISKITGIAEEILRDSDLEKLHDLSIAQKFSWAARRRTTRGEDRAYSLMGLFGVNMPMIYGEGEQAAFYRLQREIFAVYADHSIFAWQDPLEKEYQETTQEKTHEPKTYDLLAPSVSAFMHSQDIINEPYDWNIMGRPKLNKVKFTSSNKPIADYSATSHGMRIQMLLETHYDNYYIAYLACRFQSSRQTYLGLVLELEHRTGQYRRISSGEAKEYKINNSFGYHATLHDVYVSPPRLDFALSSRPVRCRLNLGNSVNRVRPFLVLMDDVAVQEAHFIPVHYHPPENTWRSLPGNTGVETSPRSSSLQFTGNGAIIYRHKETAESFAVFTTTNQPSNFPFPNNQTVMATIVDDIDSTMTAADVFVASLVHSSHLLTDLSTQMLVKRLKSGKKVILSMNATMEQADASQDIALTYHAFRLWVAVKEVGTYALEE